MTRPLHDPRSMLEHGEGRGDERDGGILVWNGMVAKTRRSRDGRQPDDAAADEPTSAARREGQPGEPGSVL